MATVRQSITALYEEAQKSAVEGAPMLAVLQSEAAGREDPAMSGNPVGPAGSDGTIPLPATAIAARFDELRRLAELEAGSTPNQAAMPHPAIGPETDMASYPLAGIDLSAGFGDAAIDMQDVAADAGIEPEDGDGKGVLVMKSDPTDIPVIDIPATSFGTVAEPAGSATEEPDGAAPPEVSADANGDSGLALPEEPPAPAADNLPDDMDIADIHTLVREAWEDEAAIGDAGLNQSDGQPAEGVFAGTAASENIETAMQEIAAAVVQSADSGNAIDVDAMKSEIIAAMRAELQAVVDSDLKTVIKAAVAEAIADMPAPAARSDKGAAKKAPKAAPKAGAKKAAGTGAKTAAKAASRKAAAKKKSVSKTIAKTGNGKAVDDGEA